ncbi:MAG: helix-turn-helix domain-containing protein [Fusobacteriaceae bacterium]|nr:helix-turn-helix domain-containing protein [Fusobacteriaceae bacterium]
MNIKDLKMLDSKACYSAFKSHDTRFDGKFFIACKTTGIYCRPICRVRMPKEENCNYFISAAAAEAAGYRPCLKCRPELAPHYHKLNDANNLAHRAAMIMEKDYLFDSNIEEVAKQLDITARHLRRVFFDEFGVTPIQYLHTHRLLLAKNLITDTNLSISDIAMNVGFGSIRRFNDSFKKSYNLSPTHIRHMNEYKHVNSQNIMILISVIPPYDWDSIISFLTDRLITGVEMVTDNKYYRTVSIKLGDKKYNGWVSVEYLHDKNSLLITIENKLMPVLSNIIYGIRSLFDTNSDPIEIYEKLESMNNVKEGLCKIGVRLPGSFDPFEMAIRAILGQQITIKAAKTLAMRVVQSFGESISTPFEGLKYAFPDAEKIYSLGEDAQNQLGPLGIVRSRSRAIYALAESLVKGNISFFNYIHPEKELNKLLLLPGIGPWTASYIGMRAFNWPDAFPHADYGVKKVFSDKNEKELKELAENWRPWRSYATINIWNFLKTEEE